MIGSQWVSSKTKNSVVLSQKGVSPILIKMILLIMCRCQVYITIFYQFRLLKYRKNVVLTICAIYTKIYIKLQRHFHIKIEWI